MPPELAVNNFDEPTNILLIYHRLDGIGAIETHWIDEFQYLNKQLLKCILSHPFKVFDR